MAGKRRHQNPAVRGCKLELIELRRTRRQGFESDSAGRLNRRTIAPLQREHTRIEVQWRIGVCHLHGQRRLSGFGPDGIHQPHRRVQWSAWLRLREARIRPLADDAGSRGASASVKEFQGREPDAGKNDCDQQPHSDNAVVRPMRLLWVDRNWRSRMGTCLRRRGCKHRAHGGKQRVEPRRARPRLPDRPARRPAGCESQGVVEPGRAARAPARPGRGHRRPLRRRMTRRPSTATRRRSRSAHRPAPVRCVRASSCRAGCGGPRTPKAHGTRAVAPAMRHALRPRVHS